MKLKKVFPIIAMLLVVLMTGCNKKEDFTGVRPKVISTDPVSEATNIAISSKISAIFSVAMDSSTITNTNFVLKQGTTAVSGEVAYTGITVTFTPAADLATNTIYTATITTGAKDESGIALAKDYTWNFTTGGVPDLTKPTVTLTDPLNNATGVSISKLIVVTFSESMDPTTLNSLTYLLKQGSTSVSGAVTNSGTTATFTPASNLEYGTVYTGMITTGAKDLAGNALAINHTFSFTTVNTPDLALPMVNSTDPLNNATGVERNKVVVLTFSEAMDPSTINSTTFTLNQGTTAVSGTVAYSGTTATFTPSNVLAASTTYTATITTGAKDLAGNALAANIVWSFTTGGATSDLAVVDLGAAGNYVILAKTAINNIPISAITGDLGLSPAATSYITGFALTNATGYATSTQVTGKLYAADMADPTPINLTTAVENMITAYNDAAGRLSPDFLELGTGNIGGLTLVPGLYKWTNTVTLPSDVTISGGENDVWIFQIAQDLTVSNGVNVTLTGGAQAKNIFWQLAGTATFGTTSHFEGIILSMTGITFQTGASFKGRALAQTAVVLDGNAVILP
nr:Ig-like domain-containing protein [Bacteroidota bacterium]